MIRPSVKQEVILVSIDEPVIEEVEQIPSLYQKFIPPMREWAITSHFGIRKDVWGGPDEDFHKGTDLVAVGKNKDVLAAADGVVLIHYLPPGTVRNGKTYKGHPVYGALIIIAHEGGVYTLYSHMSKTFIREGQEVKQGDVIGIVGSTGKSTGDHLHFEILLDPSHFF